MCRFYPNEGARRAELCDIFRHFGIDIHPGPIGSSQYATDGHAVTGRNHPKLIVEIKNEIGSTQADPSFQGLLYYDAFCDKYRLWEDVSTCHPCFIVFLAGKSRPHYSS